MNASTVINVSPAVVYEFVADPTNDVLWRSGLTDSGLISEPPLVTGSEGFAEAGKSVTRWRVTKSDGRSHIDWDLLDGPFDGSGGYRIQPFNGATSFTLVASVEPRGMFRLLGPMFKRLGTRRNASDVARLKEILEQRRGDVADDS